MLRKSFAIQYVPSQEFSSQTEILSDAMSIVYVKRMQHSNELRNRDNLTHYSKHARHTVKYIQ